jgi:hypothetical protein
VYKIVIFNKFSSSRGGKYNKKSISMKIYAIEKMFKGHRSIETKKK